MRIYYRKLRLFILGSAFNYCLLPTGACIDGVILIIRGFLKVKFVLINQTNSILLIFKLGTRRYGTG